MIKLRHDIFITFVAMLWLVTAEARYYPPKSILHGGNAEEVLDILQRNNENPAVETLLRDTSRAILRGGNPELTAMLRDNPEPFLLAVIPEISATPYDNPKSTLYGDSLKLLAMLREYTTPLLNDPAALRVREHSESDNNVVPISGINKYTINDNDVKETFNRMIETVAKVNHERILSLKKWFELENYQPQVSRTMQQKNPLIAVIIHTPNYRSNYGNLNINHLTEDPQYVMVKKKHIKSTMHSILKEIIKGTYFDHNEDDDNVSITQESDEFQKNVYLRGWNGCKKSAAKYCRKACQKAFKYVCDDYMCSKSLKKDGKKQCKTKCNAEFIESDDDDDSSSSE